MDDKKIKKCGRLSKIKLNLMRRTKKKNMANFVQQTTKKVKMTPHT